MNKKILDVCCGSRMFWFDKTNKDTVYMDIRELEDTLCDGRHISIKPDVLGDFRDIPFDDETFNMVVFDPTKTRKNQRVHEYYRNYFVAGGKDKESWKTLVELGYANKTSNAIVNSYYYVTQEGIALLSRLYQIDFRPYK